MHHRIVSTVVALIVALFTFASVLFAWATATLAPLPEPPFIPENPHAPLRRTQPCLECHNTDLGTIPITHRRFDVHTCDSCHRQAPRLLVPHSVTMGDERCLFCHGEPTRDLGIPESHLRYETRECLICHPVDGRYYDRQPAPAGLFRRPANPIPHPRDGIFEDCFYCHQIGEPDTLPVNHRRFGLDTCTECHEPGAE